MAIPVATLQSNLDALDSAIAAGLLTVEYDGKRVTYQTMSDLLRARRHIADLIAQQSAAAPSRASYAVFRKG